MKDTNLQNNIPAGEEKKATIDTSRISGELVTATDNLEKREKLQILMKAANKIIRKGVQVKEALSKLGLTESQIHKLTTPDSYNRTGYPAYELTNNNANITRLRARVAELETKETKAQEGNKTEEINGVLLTKNYELDRVQLMFPAKPNNEVLVELHKKGFHCTHEKIWQRKLTDDGVYDATNIAKRSR